MLLYGPLPYVNIVLIHSNPIPRLNQSKTNVSEQNGNRKVEQYALSGMRNWSVSYLSNYLTYCSDQEILSCFDRFQFWAV